MIDFLKIKAISFDLDDTLWPVWPTIGRAEEALAQWLVEQAPQTAPLVAIPGYLRKIREEMTGLRPDLATDLSALRREAIRVLLQRAGENPDLAEPAFEVFF
jgi:FMN phosphatase YigB (HAD superfamily)